ncbi:hypothetical protein ACFOWE_03850 [Planomonospora corallina]|uniref:Uncharacterized protein n=1 Tax=Planomonospora corallina TaxID=1806052 RepID=A0ABV8HZS1_9ACTN
MPTPRQLVLPAAAGGCLALVALVVSGAVPASDAVLLGAVVLLLGTQALVLLAVRRTDGKAQRVDARTKRCETGLAELTAAAERIGARLDEVAALLSERGLAHDEDLRAILASLGEDRLNAMALRQEVARLAGLLPHPAGPPAPAAVPAPSSLPAPSSPASAPALRPASAESGT